MVQHQRGFADSFFSPDYAAGLGVLFEKLNQGSVENEEFLSMAQMRAEAEEAYGLKLQDIAKSVIKKGGFLRDDGASARKAFDGMRKEMEEAGKSHLKVAQNIQTMVIRPFSRWANDHAQRINSSHDTLQIHLKQYDKQVTEVKRLRALYYNKFRIVEDLEEEGGLAFPVPSGEDSKGKGKEREKSGGDMTPKDVLKKSSTIGKDDDDEYPVEIGDVFYQKPQLIRLLSTMLSEISMKEVKVPILGTYRNCSQGDQITAWINANFGPLTLPYLEKIGQDLVDHGYLRLIGAVGKSFANSSVFNYQWTKRSFLLAGKEQNNSIRRTDTLLGKVEGVMGQAAGTAVGDYLNAWGWTTNSAPEGETQPERLKREARESEEAYKQSVWRADGLRCRLEELMIEHLTYMEKCELDRLKALKSVILDFSASLSNILPSLQSTVDNLLLYQETIQPEKDLRFLIESYQTGGFAPRVVKIENYYNAAEDQTFGVDLELRARGDGKRVPGIVSAILMHLDERYLELENDDLRKGVWLMDVPLTKTHQLRGEINNGSVPDREVLMKYEPAVTASTLKLYLLELPDSLVSSTVYDSVKSIYSSNGNLEDMRSRISAIQNTLSQLMITNIATIDALMQHFGRLKDVTNGDEEWVRNMKYVDELYLLGILRPRVESSVTQHDRHATRLVQDLILNREKVFTDLKQKTRPKARPETLDESQRRQKFEARTRAVSAALRSPRLSPAEHFNGGISGVEGGKHSRRLSGITGVLGTKPPNLHLDLGDDRSHLESPPGEISPTEANLQSSPESTSGETPTNETIGNPVEVRITPDDGSDLPTKRLSLNRNKRTVGSGLQRHIKKETTPAGIAGDVEDKDAEVVGRNITQSLDGQRPVGVTLTDGPVNVDE